VYATVILNTRQSGIGNGLTYKVGADSGVWDVARARVGLLVKAPLRKKLVEGIIVDLHDEKPEGDYDVKEIAKVLSAEPLLTKNQIELARWIADYYVCPLKQSIGLWLPGGEWEKLLPEREEFLRYTIQLNSIVDRKLGKKQQELIDYLQGKDWVRWKEVKEAVGVERNVVRKLIEQRDVESRIDMSHLCHPEERGASVPSVTKGVSLQHDVLFPSDITLTPRQAAAYKAIKADTRPTLLFGITGSGKTEIYAALIRDAIESGKSAILLLPEILLTENFIERFQKLIDRESIAIVHSRLTPANRRAMWRRCREGSIRLVIGSRSALFSPLPHLSLIIVDEEHEWTYKNEQSPRYHAGKVAERMSISTRHAERSEGEAIAKPERSRSTSQGMEELPLELMRGASTASFARYGGAQDFAQHDVIQSLSPDVKVLFGSATPSVESWYKAKNGIYQLVELPERYGGAMLPSVQIVDFAAVQTGRYYPLSPTLINAIRTRLERKEQTILFLNRRGFATSLLCMECRYRFEDSANHLPYTVHFRGTRPYLLSHHTGEMMDVPAECPKCRSANLRQVGAGTQRIESLISELFPAARLLRADADTLTSPEKMRTLLEKMKTGQADILLGTQSVVKGLDLPGVTLAAVLLADIGLSLPHFRAGERVFQLLTQLTGRSGRKNPGEVIIQTFRPKAIEVELAARHDVRTYLDQELTEREKAHYPPDTEMVRFVFSQENAENESKEFVEGLKRKEEAPGARYQISRTPSLFGGGKVWHVFVRGRAVWESLKNVPVLNGIVDIDPIECL